MEKTMTRIYRIKFRHIRFSGHQKGYFNSIRFILVWVLLVLMASFAGCEGPFPLRADDPPLSDGGIQPEKKEVCDNGLDDNGDGQVDEGCTCTRDAVQACYGGPAALADKGICTRGEQTCSGSSEFATWGPCTGWVEPQEEIPGNGEDDDCDGAIDTSVGTGTWCKSLTRVSSTTDGEPAVHDTWVTDISGDGQYVLLNTVDSEWMSGQGEGWALLVHDQKTKKNEHITDQNNLYRNRWNWGAVISDNGQYVAFQQEQTNQEEPNDQVSWKLLVHDRSSGNHKQILQHAYWSWGWGALDISADGRHLVYFDGDPTTPDSWGLMLHDQTTEKSTSITKGNGNTWYGFGASISADGKHLAYTESDSTDQKMLVRVFNRDTGETETVGTEEHGSVMSVGPGWPGNTAISADGNFVAYSMAIQSDLDSTWFWKWKVVLIDRSANETKTIFSTDSLNHGDWYMGSDISMSADGRYLIFHKPKAENAANDANAADEDFPWSWDIHVYDRQSDQTTLVAQTEIGPGITMEYYGFRSATISADGHCIAFTSMAQLLPDDTGHSQAYVTPNPVFQP